MKLISRILLPLLLFSYIAIETYAKLHHTSICGTTGCELAGELLKFNSLYLNYFGALGALFIALFGWLSLRREGFEKLFYITLYAAIAFESIMISYQLLANPEPCIFCLGVYGGLLLIALFARWRYLLYALPAVAALFVSMSALSLTANRSIITADGTYLIGSKTCPHCKKVKTYFAQSAIDYTNISIKDANARFFIKQLDIDTIPVLVVKEKNHTTILKGDQRIIAYFDNKEKKETATESDDTNPVGIYNQEEGCSASILQDTGCSETTEVPLQ